MILEPAVRHILHCSRCNVPYVAPGAMSPFLWTTVGLSTTFAPGMPVAAGEWTRIHDRVLCPGCWKVSGDDERPVEREPLLAEEAARVAAEQAVYGHVEIVSPVGDQSSVSTDWVKLETAWAFSHSEAGSG